MLNKVLNTFSIKFASALISLLMAIVISRYLHASGKGAQSIILTTISFILILTSKFDQVITYAGFTLNLFTLLAVIGIFVHRYKFPNIERPYKTWGYPVVPIIFGIIVTWISVYLLIFKTTESLWGLLTMALGLFFYFINQLLFKNKPIKN